MPTKNVTFRNYCVLCYRKGTKKLFDVHFVMLDLIKPFFFFIIFLNESLDYS